MGKLIDTFADAYIFFMEKFFSSIGKVREISKKVFSNPKFWNIARTLLFLASKSGGYGIKKNSTTKIVSAGKKNKL